MQPVYNPVFNIELLKRRSQELIVRSEQLKAQSTKLGIVAQELRYRSWEILALENMRQKVKNSSCDGKRLLALVKGVYKT